MLLKLSSLKNTIGWSKDLLTVEGLIAGYSTWYFNGIVLRTFIVVRVYVGRHIKI